MAEEFITNFEDAEEGVLYGLQAWTQYLSIRDLPARASTIKRLRKLIDSDKSTVQQLANIVRKDPVLTLYVVRAAQLKHNETNTEVKSILHAVTSLGYDGITEIAKHIQPMSLNPTNIQQKRFLHAISDSHHGAYQLQEWMHLKSLPLIDESYLAALFYSIGFWALWFHAPLHMQKIQKRIHENKEPPIAAEKDVLGCTMQMISQNLAKTWQLSELTQLSQDHSTSPTIQTLKKLHRRALKDPNLSSQEVRKLNHITQQKYFPIKLANWIALTSARDWYSAPTMRNVDLISDYLGKSPEQTIALIHATCAKSSRDYFAPGISSPAAQLLFIDSNINIHYKMGAKELSLIQSKYPIPQVPMIKPYDVTIHDDDYQNKTFYQSIETLLKADLEDLKFKKMTQVLSALIQGLEKGLGIKRVTLFSISRNTQQIKAIQSVGFEESHPMRSFQSSTASPDLFNSVCEKANYIVFDKLTSKKLSPTINKNFRSVCNDEFMLLSLFKDSAPLALVYIDNQTSSLSNFARERSRNLCDLAMNCLIKF
jgi:HD-like signal output (HDOD) protein